jgi:Mg-chelatase subunit ChlI
MFDYPFAAVVGMERAKRSLVLHAVDPRIGGTLLSGHRGCAKSTLARGFAALLPQTHGRPAPFVDVPLGVSEDRLLGAVHGEALLRTGAWIPQPGLLEKADGGVLYIDEINLLPDAVSDLLLDSAASGVHRQERDGLSQVLRSRYILIGTMNPEEGDLRPQLSDRFAHGVPVDDSFSPEERVEIGRRRLAFEDDPEAFVLEWSSATTLLNSQLQTARNRLLQVSVPEELRFQLAERAQKAGLEGMRAELAVLRTARAAAAFRGGAAASGEDLEEAWDLCLGHRPTSASAPPAGPPPGPQNASSVPKPSSSATANQAPAPSAPATPHSQALTPKTAQNVPIPLQPMQKPRILSLPQPLFASRRQTAALKATARFETCRLLSGPVSWQASLVASLKQGWRPGMPGWTWVRTALSPMRRMWVLLDASRSTGAAAFLGQAREALAGMVRNVKRASLLIIHNNRLEWALRNATAGRIQERLASLPNASGASPIAAAIRKLSRAVGGSRPTNRDTVCLCSDGLPTLRKGETAAQAGAEMRSALRHLRRNSPLKPLWLCPAMSRGASAWLAKMNRGAGCELVQLPLK